MGLPILKPSWVGEEFSHRCGWSLIISFSLHFNKSLVVHMTDFFQRLVSSNSSQGTDCRGKVFPLWQLSGWQATAAEHSSGGLFARKVNCESCEGMFVKN